MIRTQKQSRVDPKKLQLEERTLQKQADLVADQIRNVRKPEELQGIYR